MNPVRVVAMPFNYRCELYDRDGPGAGPHFPSPDDPDEARGPGPSAFGQQWAELPIPMPETLTLFTVAGRVIAARADDVQIRWKDIDTVVRGVAAIQRRPRNARRRHRLHRRLRPAMMPVG